MGSHALLQRQYQASGDDSLPFWPRPISRTTFAFHLSAVKPKRLTNGIAWASRRTSDYSSVPPLRGIRCWDPLRGGFLATPRTLPRVTQAQASNHATQFATETSYSIVGGPFLGPSVDNACLDGSCSSWLLAVDLVFAVRSTAAPIRSERAGSACSNP